MYPEKSPWNAVRRTARLFRAGRRGSPRTLRVPCARIPGWWGHPPLESDAERMQQLKKMCPGWMKKNRVSCLENQSKVDFSITVDGCEEFNHHDESSTDSKVMGSCAYFHMIALDVFWSYFQ